MSRFTKLSILCLSVTLGFGNPYIFAEDDKNGDVPCECQEDTCKVTCFSGHLGINPCRKLLTNFIDPVINNPTTGKCEENTNPLARTNFSGNIAVNPQRTLFVNRINPVKPGEVCDGQCDNPARFYIGNPTGITCFSGDVGLEQGKDLWIQRIRCGHCSETGERIRTGKPLCIDCTVAIPGDCDGDLGRRGLMTNFIRPVLGNCNQGVEPHFNGVVCVEGNLGVRPDRELRVNRICGVQDPCCAADSDTCVTICNPRFEGKLCVDGDLGALGDCQNKNGILTNFIHPVLPGQVDDPNCQPVCNRNDCGTTCFSGNAAIAPCRVLRTNFVEPVRDGETCCEANRCGTTCFQGNVGINQCRRLLVNHIDPVLSGPTDCAPPCPGDAPQGCQRFDEGTTCFSGNVGIDCRKKLFVNEINPGKLVLDQSCSFGECEECVYQCVEDDRKDAVTRFSGNVSLDPCKTLFLRHIDPVCRRTLTTKEENGREIICVTDINCDTACKDDKGITCFSGNVGVNRCRKLLVSKIDPVKMCWDKDCCDHDRSCDCTYECDCPRDCDCPLICKEDKEKKATTCFSGNVGIDKCRKLLVNRIDPVTMKRDWKCCDHEKICGCEWDCDCERNCDCPRICKEDRDCHAITCFSGNVGVDKCRKLLVNFIDPVKMCCDTRCCDHERMCECIEECDCPRDCDCPLICRENRTSGAVTCFSGNVGIKEGRSLFVDRICPVKPVDTPCDGDCPIEGCMEHAEGCLELTGQFVKIPGKLLVNEIDPFGCDERGNLDPDAFMKFNSNVSVKRDLEVNGDLFVDGALLYSGAPKTRAIVDSEAIVRSMLESENNQVNIGELAYHLARVVEKMQRELEVLKGLN